MANLLDILKEVGQLTKGFVLLQDRQAEHTADLKALEAENAELRKEIAALTVRVAVLEEGRKTIAADVKAALIETISTWEKQRLQSEIENLKHGK